ncbi:nickel pincer cofactor biosynthesis protein LarB [Guggenheimella bovis]
MIKDLLEKLQRGEVCVDEVMLELKKEPFEEVKDALVDHHRSLRQGQIEVIYGASKTVEQIATITKALRKRSDEAILVTRVSKEQAQELQKELPFTYHEVARILTLGEKRKIDGLGKVVLCAAGTSDLPVLEEAAVTLEYLGNDVVRLTDVGVAGLHRILSHLDVLMNASVVIAIAGMEGALASVLGGLVSAPVIAVPTSVGYGANFGGLAALLAMLNSCANGVSVVNIDNGFGAAVQASRINHMEAK